ncbi:MAG: hypothetical protein J7493_11625 [Porphyrobacter sp.]|nr:hypothetical protein [Porphyrobacter sp.]
MRRRADVDDRGDEGELLARVAPLSVEPTTVSSWLSPLDLDFEKPTLAETLTPPSDPGSFITASAAL